MKRPAPKFREPHPHRKARPIAVHAHPLVREFFARLEDECTSVTDVAERAGLGLATLVKWKSKHSPTVVSFEAALNVIGCELKIVERKDP